MSKTQIHKDICELLHDTYKIKNSDYGDSFSKVKMEYSVAIIIRLMDKLERLKMLYNKEYTAKVNESIDDTLLDLANYAIMELVERNIEEREIIEKDNLHETNKKGGKDNEIK